MNHPKSARELAQQRGPVSLVLSVLLLVNLIPSTRSAAASAAKESYFIDPTAVVQCVPADSCRFGSNVYIGPFATILAGSNSRQKSASITVGNNSNVQDNTLLDTTTNNRPIELGDSVIIAHGASVYGGARIGITGHCPEGVPVCASFVGFNSEVAEGAVVERDAMVMHLAKVGPGVTIPSEHVVLPGKSVMSNAEVPFKTIEIAGADRDFMAAVIRVNIALAAGYNTLETNDRTSVCGVNVNPETDFTPRSLSPSFNGVRRTDPRFRNRLIGDIQFAEPTLPRMGINVSLRADEGTPFIVGTIGGLDNFVTFHALEHTELRLGNRGTYGLGSLVHGGTMFGKITSTGDDFQLGDNSVLYNSKVGSNCRILPMSLVANADLPSGRVVQSRKVLLGNVESDVEWIRRSRKITKNNRDRCTS